MRGLAGPLLIVATIALVYAPSLGNGLVYDDHVLISDQPAPQGLRDYARIFAEPHFPGLPYYRPVTRLTFLAQKAMHGDDPFPYHLVNLLLIAGAALAVRWVLRGAPFSLGEAPSTLAAVIVAVHPAASSTVYPICSGRETLLPALLALVALGLWLRGRTAASHIATTAAIFGKEQMIVLPVALAAADLLGLAPHRASGWRRWSRYAVPAAVVAGYLGVRHALFGGGEYIVEAISAPLRPALSYLYSLQTVVAPFAELRYEPAEAVWLSPVRGALAIAGAAALLVAVARIPPVPRRGAWFLLLWFVLVQLPTVNILRQEAPFDERYVFLASFGLVGACAVAAARSAGLIRYRPALLAGGVAAAAALGLISHGRAPSFADEGAFSRQWLRHSPDAVVARTNLAVTMMGEGRDEEASAEFARVLAVHPDNVPALVNQAVILMRGGRPAEAVALLERSVAVEPDNGEAHGLLGMALEGVPGRGREAIAHLGEAVRLAPRDVNALVNLGLAQARAGENGPAERAFREALRLDPGRADAAYQLGNVLAASRRFGEAEEAYRRAIAARPGFVEARNNLGKTLSELGRSDEALAVFDALVAEDPANPLALLNRGIERQRRGETAAAREDLASLRRLDPGAASVLSEIVEGRR